MRITLITPSYNQATFIERTIRSVLDQNYPDLEYFILDGQSTDGSVDIIQKYASRLAWWVSQKDAGQSAAINIGLRKSTGDIVGWLNSDDTLAPGALHAIAQAYSKQPQIDLLYGHTCLIDEEDRLIRRLCAVQTNAKELIRHNPHIFSQPGTTWRRRLMDKIGYLDESLHYAMDADYWIRAAQNGRICFLNQHLGNLRVQPASKTNQQHATRERESVILAGRYGTQAESGIEKCLFQAKRMLRIVTSVKTLRYRFGKDVNP